MSPVVVLEEYEPRLLELGLDAAIALGDLAGDALAIRPSGSSRMWSVHAASLVGTIVTPAIRILIRPKVSAANLFHLLEAEGDPLEIGPEVFDYAASGDLAPAFATFFVRHLERAIARGIVRSYEPRLEDLAAVRGRISFRSQIRRAGLPIPIGCEFDEHTADTQLNRILGAAADRLARFPGVAASTRRALLQLCLLFEQAGRLRESDLRRPTPFTRLNGHFRTADHLARMTLASSSLLDEHGQVGAGTFLVDMNVVFEKFVEDRLRRHLRGIVEVRPQQGLALDVDGHVRMIPDLVFRRGGADVYVADSKYKLAADGFGRQADYYQLLAYCIALGLREGALIYCSGAGGPPMRDVLVRDEGGDRRLAAFAVRLDGAPPELEQRMRQLGAALTGRFLDVDRSAA